MSHFIDILLRKETDDVLCSLPFVTVHLMNILPPVFYAIGQGWIRKTLPLWGRGRAALALAA